MRTLSVGLLVIVSATAVVSAEPVREESSARVRYGADRAPQPAEQPTQSADGWIELASATPASHGREFISVDAGAGALTRLRLTAATGRPYLSAVRVDFKDKSHKTFLIDKVAIAGRQPIVVDLKGAREVDQVVVVTDRTSTGSYVVEARPGITGVASR